MNSPRKSWILFGSGAAAVLVVLSWMTSKVMDFEKKEAASKWHTERQDAIRLALWRLDSALTPILVQEASRPDEHYRPVFRETSGLLAKSASVPVMRISPLVGFRSDLVRLHFEATAPEGCSSPQSPDISSPQLAEFREDLDRYAGEIEEAKIRLDQLRELLQEPGALESLGIRSTPFQISSLAPDGQALQQQAEIQKGLSEYQARASNVQWAQNAYPAGQNKLSTVSDSAQRDLRAVWVKRSNGKPSELFFVRPKTGSSMGASQGIWVDWPKLQKWLCQGISNLLPKARIVAVESPPSDASKTWMLATIPAMLVPGSDAAPLPSGMTPLRGFLAMSWLAALAALAVVAFSLRSSIELGERRGRFVSAVTHELRTPLTTFQLYSQMLADGMVPDEKSRKEYLETLKKESERLARIVESVLLYARVEGKRTVQRRESIDAQALAERVRPALERAAQDCGMTLQMDLGGAEGTVLLTDPQIVQQILFNLVDNSCKYAHAASDRRLHLDWTAKRDRVEILYFDHGPGIAQEDEGRLFQPFQRGATHVAGSISGTGLGLSLARALARDLGGDLSLVKRPGAGACFLLRLPRGGS